MMSAIPCRAGVMGYSGAACTIALLVCTAGSADAQRDTMPAHAAFVAGRAAMQGQHYGDAIKAFQKAIALDSMNSDYHVALGDAHTRDLIAASFIRKPMIARRILPEYDRAVALNPANLAAADGRLGYFLNAPTAFGGGMDKAKAEAARIRSLNAYRGDFAQAQIDEKEGNGAKVEADYRELMRVYPDSSAPVVSLSVLLQNKARYAEAFTLIDGRLATFPNDTVVTYQLGRAAALSGQQLSRGEAALRKFIAMLGARDTLSQAVAHYRLGAIHEKQGDPAAARAEYDRSLELNPRLEEASTARKRLAR
jgi:tetratricopeptide (TPR) repeat protein